ncbi:TetR family transcriptional regulator [Streptomyces sp. NPDC059743]|uniref:TetR/AcrR family transcriptional regulator n=1 Tax=Streptomyces sp. NPDC059743 TaxID=3346928 RepID=UPI00365EDA68
MIQPPKRKRDRAATSAALLAAARARFALVGYDATSVRDIARDVGVDATLVFRYFGSKERLFEQASQPTEEQAGDSEGTPSGDVPTRLLHMTMKQDAPTAEGSRLTALLLSSGRPECREQLTERLYETYVRDLEEVVDLPDRELRAELLTALLLGINMARSVARTPALSEACVDDIAPYFDQISAILLGTPAPGRTKATSGEPTSP